MTKPTTASTTKTFVRFTLLQRLQHIIFLISFSTLGFTGLPQKYPLSPISIGIFNLLGGVEVVRQIHHTSAIVMMIVSLVHVLEILYHLLVMRAPISMIPWINDLIHVYDDVMYYLGRRKHKAYYGRYSYAEKAEYLALIWGTVVMGLTGFMMWNPISTVRFLPGEAIPAAKAAHGGEAVLAVLAIIIWHFYHVHIKTLNKSMFTGKLSREEMEHEHPAELAIIESGKHVEPIPPAVLRKRQMIYTPIAIAILAVFSYGFYYFVGYETTAITTVPKGETAAVFVPVTPTPAPTPTVAPTASAASAASTALDWQAFAGPLFQKKCAACHGAAAVGGLNLSTYADALKGSKNGVVIVPKASSDSKLFQIQSAGGHPGQLTAEELTQVKEWIDAGATETTTAAPAALTWDAYAGQVFQQKCAACHGAAAIAGLNLTTYADALKGSANGPVIVPKDSASSKMIQVQSAGGHPGQLTAEELANIKEWIDAGAAEK
jgi:cytochrome b subunit of formate dehydrogenase/mono/diheme cytochrome c family protein